MAIKNKKVSKKNENVSSLTQFTESLNITIQSYKDTVKANRHLLLLDILCGFLVIVGIIQFSFMCIIRDNFPFNAFLSGFISCVGQFVLLVSLRLQIVESFPGISKERAFGEFTIASLILHFICLHFIN